MTSSNYQINLVDLDSTYIVSNDPNYNNIQAAVSNRKTVVFGQQLVQNIYPQSNVNNALNYSQVLPGIQTDQDSTIIIGVGPTSVFYNNRANVSQTLVKGSFGLAVENYPQSTSWQISGAAKLAPEQNTNFFNMSNLAVTNKSTSSEMTAFAVLSNGTLWSWGTNNNSISGANTTTNFFYPAQIGTLNVWATVAAGRESVLAIQTPGTLWSWGSNSAGQLGLGDTNTRSSPVQIGALSVWRRISCGNDFSLAIQSNGTLWTWGRNDLGQLGSGTTTNRSSPVQVGALSVWTQIAGSFNSLAIQSNGTLWSWGYNFNGQLGLNDTVDRSSPVQVGALSVWTQIAIAGQSSFAIQSNGTLWAWGRNVEGNLGLGDTTNRSSPVQVGSLSLWTQINCGYRCTLAIQSKWYTMVLG